MFKSLRVLDLSDDGALLCGQILSDLGADVVQIEPPAGLRARGMAPLGRGALATEASLHWQAYGRGKRSVVLDLEAEADRARFNTLVASADVLIASDTPDRLKALGLAYESLKVLNPQLIQVSITPFGMDGPKARYRATDLVSLAAAGTLFLTGTEDRPPLRISVPQAALHAACDACVGILIALRAREQAGLGEHLDISVQHSASFGTLFGLLDTAMNAEPRQRAAQGYLVGDFTIKVRFDARDGWVVSVPGVFAPTARFMSRLVAWAVEVGVIDARYLDEDWAGYLSLVAEGKRSEADYAPIEAGLEQLFRSRSKRDLMDEALRRKLLVAPVFSLGELASSDHILQRKALTRLDDTSVGSVGFPGPFARFSGTPMTYKSPAPTLGSDGPRVFAEWTADSGATAVAASHCDDEGAHPAQAPLAGLKILDLFWVIAGSASTRILADYGATVVHVETRRSPDTLRGIPPFKDGIRHPENSGAYHSTNAGKLHLSLDLKHEQSRKVILDLVAWCDVITESFSPGVMKQLGLSYDDLKKINPDIIMVSSSLMGQDGPWGTFAGYGNLASAVCGFNSVTGWPDQPPTSPYGAHTDYIAPRYNAIAILAALEHRRKTGQGQHVDQSQLESGLHWLAPALLHAQVNGEEWGCRGNDDWNMSPHGVFPAHGADSWVAIAIRDDADWRAFCAVADGIDLADLTATERRDRSQEIAGKIAAWASSRPAVEVERVLQSAGVPAHAVVDLPTLASDPQLLERGATAVVPHPLHGFTTIEGTRLKFSRTRPVEVESGTSYGAHNQDILTSILGYDTSDIGKLENSKALF